MEGKKVSESRAIMLEVMNPECANPAGNIHGGNIDLPQILVPLTFC